QLSSQLGQLVAVPGLRVREGRLVFGSQTVQFQLLLVGARGETALIDERLRQLRSQLVKRLALAGLRVGEGPVMLGTDQILFAGLLLNARGYGAVLGETLR